MLGDIIALLGIWNFIGFFIVGCLSRCSDLDEYLNPISIYHNTHLNIFGCIVFTIIRNLLCPIVSIIYWTVAFFYWLMTVGRK
jgi:hypothetical protein